MWTLPAGILLVVIGYFWGRSDGAYKANQHWIDVTTRDKQFVHDDLCYRVITDDAYQTAKKMYKELTKPKMPTIDPRLSNPYPIALESPPPTVQSTPVYRDTPTA